MKNKVILMLGFCGLYGVASAQKSELFNAKNQYANFQDFQRQKQYAEEINALNDGKTSTDKAILHEKTKDNPELWAYRGVLYAASAALDTAKDNATTAIPTAVEAVKKAKELDVKKNNEEVIKSAEKYLANVFQNKGVTCFKGEDYVCAYECFKFVGETLPTDTTFSYYAAIAARKAKMNAAAAQYFKIAIERGIKAPAAFVECSRSLIAEKDTAGAIAILNKGQQVNPKDLNVVFEEINIFITRGKAAEITGKVELAISNDPSNKVLHFVAGIAYEKAKNKEKAEGAYKKAIEIDSYYFEPTYNLGAMYVNNANDLISQANKLPMNKQKEYNAFKVQFESEFKKALPYLEKAHEIKPKDRNTILSLRELYTQIKETAKADEMTKLLGN